MFHLFWIRFTVQKRSGHRKHDPPAVCSTTRHDTPSTQTFLAQLCFSCLSYFSWLSQAVVVMLWLHASPDTPRRALCESRSLTWSWCERDVLLAEWCPSMMIIWFGSYMYLPDNYRKARSVLGACIAFWALSQLSWITSKHEMHHRRADSESVVFVPWISKLSKVETTLHFTHKDSMR